jgi:hypothetical protein
MLGTVLALVLVLASTGMFTSLTSDLRLQFGQIERQDATVATRPGSGADPAAVLRAVPGVSTVEASRVAAVTAGHDRYRYPTQLRGCDPTRECTGSGRWVPRCTPRTGPSPRRCPTPPSTSTWSASSPGWTGTGCAGR